MENADGLFPVTKDELVQEGGIVTLRCPVQENDNSSLQWSNPAQQTLFFDDKKALRDNRIALVYYSRHELAISISNMTLRDEGDYTCSIFTMPVRTAVAKVVVLAAPKKPEISGYIGPIVEGRTITLMCNTSGTKPLPTIRWLKGSDVMEGQTYESDIADQRAYALSNVVNLTVWRKDNGAVIECAVNHRALQDNVYTAQQRIEVHYSPEVVIEASKEVPEEGEEFMLHCYGKGNPEPSYFNWLRFNGELSERAVVRHENLSFTYLNKTDAGVYQCVAKNIIGTGAKNYSLRVHGDPLDLAPASPPAPVNVSLTPSRHDSTTSSDTDPLSQLTQSSIDHAVIGGIVAVIVFIALCLFIVLVRYLIRHKGTYLTHEAKGLDDAPDADTAIINAEVGHSSSDEKKEYFI
ncbi:LOW QUALITY PROTEIN: cell adhesion molecule 2-like [Leucoraja erinacea]|uniref:LOW QUALITY PROTEIN: cell adhesion molecule 2-like n=1 Tax=Leucoraja erinaceus TaxID=7782 RepID=UPI0024554A58|nr:LOW QUALITY PROTEIN: cell adhesion molecule 2-like [Leucoraja erinacea]